MLYIRHPPRGMAFLCNIFFFVVNDVVVVVVIQVFVAFFCAELKCEPDENGACACERLPCMSLSLSLSRFLGVYLFDGTERQQVHVSQSQKKRNGHFWFVAQHQLPFIFCLSFLSKQTEQLHLK